MKKVIGKKIRIGGITHTYDVNNLAICRYLQLKPGAKNIYDPESCSTIITGAKVISDYIDDKNIRRIEFTISNENAEKHLATILKGYRKNMTKIFDIYEGEGL